jgi:hypothetical protein
MNNKERFWRIMNYQPVDQLPFWADWLGPWKTWQEQGLPVPENLPPDWDEKAWFVDHFGFEGMYSCFWGTNRVPVNIGLCPGFEPAVISETGAYRVIRQGDGVIVRQMRNNRSSLVTTQFLEHPIKSRKDWLRFRDEHLDPHQPGRYPPEDAWNRLKAEWKKNDAVISIDGGSFYGFLRDWIGVEPFSYLLYDDPRLVQEMFDYLGDFFIEVLHRALHEVPGIDFAMFWEDMCYNAGPLLSPAMFRRFMLPNYKRVTRFLAEHGVHLSWVDCDGNIEALLPLWLEGGVRGFYPLEVASGMDAAKLRKQHGQSIVMWGNVDKRELAKGKAAIDAELARLAPVARQGGFIPLVDHGVPDDVPYANYLYYLEGRKRLTGDGFTGN